jgi:ubiquitin-protein ligase
LVTAVVTLHRFAQAMPPSPPDVRFTPKSFTPKADIAEGEFSCFTYFFLEERSRSGDRE